MFGLHPKISSHIFHISFDIHDVLARKEDNLYKRLHVGVQYIFADTLSVSTGINQGYPTAGVAFLGSWFRSDLGFYTLETLNRQTTRLG